MLLAIVHGVGPCTIAALRVAAGLPEAAAAIPMPAGDTDWQHFFGDDGDATPWLRDVGVAVDRSNLVLRPAHWSDADAIAGIDRRPTGPAQVTILELRAVLESCRRSGPAALPAAIGHAADRLRHIADRLRAGDPCEIWLLGLGELEPVSRSFDFDREWRRGLPPPLGDELSTIIAPAVVTIGTTSLEATERARATLASPPFRGKGTGVVMNPFRLEFRASHGLAFGARRQPMRAAHREEATTVAVLPRPTREPALPLDLRGFVARFWLRASGHGLDLDVPRGAPTTATSTDLESVPSLVEHAVDDAIAVPGEPGPRLPGAR
ncbi:MAG: hypothetical protein KDC98_00775 [Planctomycetes bacterium]|nr:hypothetical protein [Planctomycetota bacterium]